MHDAEASAPFFKRAIEAGINFFDTADVYGWEVEHGLDPFGDDGGDDDDGV